MEINKLDYISASAVISYLTNPYSFYKHYVIKERDNLDTVASLIGKGMHSIIDAKLLDKKLTLSEIQVNTCKNAVHLTLDQVETIFKKLEHLYRYIHSERDTVLSHVIKEVQSSSSFEIEKEFFTDIVTKNQYSTKLKGFIDCHFYDENGYITIIDWKSVTKFANQPKINYIIQGILYAVPFLNEGKVVRNIKFVEIKKSDNRDGSDVCNVVEINLADYEQMANWVATIIETLLDDVKNKKIWLPNPSDMFDPNPVQTLAEAIKRFDK